MLAKGHVVGILAHVDSGKTTLAESMMYNAGAIRRLGRVDHQDSFLDNNGMERKRGITIFSKQACFTWNFQNISLLDTPGHVDFSAEMERTLQVLDYAILVISGPEGIQAHTKTLWMLLERYEIPTVIFVNKMDQGVCDMTQLTELLEKKLSQRCVNFSIDHTSEEWMENVAMTDEAVMEHYLDCGEIDEEALKRIFAERRIFPCFFGSALKNQGITEFLDGFTKLCRAKEYPEEFSARVFKIGRDEQNTRLTHIKITGGRLKVKQVVNDEKIDQIRVYSGAQFESCEEMTAGSVCTVTGLEHTFCGQGLGMLENSVIPILEPIMTYKVNFINEVNPFVMYGKIRVLEEEDPCLHIIWNEKLREIHMQIMGDVQIDIIRNMIFERFGEDVYFDAGSIVYKETIAKECIGIGHFEPLRHYAEVHIKMEPLEKGSGIEYKSECSEDVLDKNWQRLILTNLKEKAHKGVLTGSDITDVRYVIVNGRAHLKHTEGGDFRQATYRAVRQGLMSAESVLLEPYYSFRLELPQDCLGRAMTDITKMCGKMDDPVFEAGQAILTGSCPVDTMQDYSREVISYTHGEGKLFMQVCGYDVCHNPEEVMKKSRYDAQADLENTPDSVFCAHGAGFVVPWYEVQEYAHLELEKEQEIHPGNYIIPQKSSFQDGVIGQDEIDEIMERTYGRTRQERTKWAKTVHAPRQSEGIGETGYAPKKKLKEYLLVDGYNIIFAWQELNELSRLNIDAARDRLMDILCNYQGYVKCELILVFDAYKVSGGKGSVFDYHNIHVVYTKEAETADQYIEKITHKLTKEYNVTVATSDRLEQMIIFGAGANRISAQGLLEEVKRINQDISHDIDQYNQKKEKQMSELGKKLEQIKGLQE